MALFTNEKIVSVLNTARDEEAIDDEALEYLAEKFGVELPEKEYEVEVTVTRTLVLRIKGASPAGRLALRGGDESYLQESMTINGDEIDLDSDFEVIDSTETDESYEVESLIDAD